MAHPRLLIPVRRQMEGERRRWVQARRSTGFPMPFCSQPQTLREPGRVWEPFPSCFLWALTSCSPSLRWGVEPMSFRFTAAKSTDYRQHHNFPLRSSLPVAIPGVTAENAKPVRSARAAASARHAQGVLLGFFLPERETHLPVRARLQNPPSSGASVPRLPLSGCAPLPMAMEWESSPTRTLARPSMALPARTT